MFFMIYSAHPNDGSEERSKYGGAAVACWINVDNPDLARAKAQQMIREEGWTVDGLEEEYPITREMAETSEGLEYYEQALIDRQVIVFFTYPRNDKNEEADESNS